MLVFRNLNNVQLITLLKNQGTLYAHKSRQLRNEIKVNLAVQTVLNNLNKKYKNDRHVGGIELKDARRPIESPVRFLSDLLLSGSHIGEHKS